MRVRLKMSVASFRGWIHQQAWGMQAEASQQETLHSSLSPVKQSVNARVTARDGSRRKDRLVTLSGRETLRSEMARGAAQPMLPFPDRNP